MNKIGVVFLVFFILYIFIDTDSLSNTEYQKKSNYSSQKKSYNNVSISDFEIIDCFGKRTSSYFTALGEVKNNGSIDATVKIQVTARNKNGRMVDSFKLWANGTSNTISGQTVSFSYPLTEEKGFLTLECQIVEARELKGNY